MRRWIPWIVVVLLVALGGLAIARWVIAQVDAETQQVAAAAGEAATATPPGGIVSDERLFDPELDPQSRESLTEKLAMATQQAADQSAGEVNAAPKDRLPPTPTTTENRALMGGSQAVSGIFNGSEGMVKPEEALINNYWQGMLNGQAAMLMAGSEPQDTSKGLVILVSSDGFSVTGFQRISAPEGISSLKVIEASGATLTLEDLSGTRVQFDLLSGTFVP